MLIQDLGKTTSFIESPNLIWKPREEEEDKGEEGRGKARKPEEGKTKRKTEEKGDN